MKIILTATLAAMLAHPASAEVKVASTARPTSRNPALMSGRTPWRSI